MHYQELNLSGHFDGRYITAWPFHCSVGISFKRYEMPPHVAYRITGLNRKDGSPWSW